MTKTRASKFPHRNLAGAGNWNTRPIYERGGIMEFVTAGYKINGKWNYVKIPASMAGEWFNNIVEAFNDKLEKVTIDFAK